MIRSMTGYGRYEAENEESRLVVEIKSVNHRYCDISIRLPKNLNPFENIIRKQLKDRISRGKIDVFVTYEKVSKAEGSITYHDVHRFNHDFLWVLRHIDRFQFQVLYQLGKCD